MVTPNVWGQGQLFAFSALDGSASVCDDFVGTLSGDRIGIVFHTQIRRELVLTQLLRPQFRTVAGDVILLDSDNGGGRLVYADTHLIVGSAPGCPVVMVDGACRRTVTDGMELQDTADGEFTALLWDGERFAFAFGHTAEEAAQTARRGIAMDPAAEAEKKLAFFRQYGVDRGNPYDMLYAKFLSVMKTQLYSPEGRFRRIWSTPDRLPHRYLWLWDSVFHAVGFRNLDPRLAEELILAVLDTQREDGFISHMSTPTESSAITQPPVIAWGAWQVYERGGSKAFLQTVFDANDRYLQWCRRNRRDTEEELYTWLTQMDVNCRCDESGMDNSPRFDAETRLQAIDYSCFAANEFRFMAKMAAELENPEGECRYGQLFRQAREAINGKLWCPADGFYYDYDLCAGKLHKVSSVASFLPLFAGICSPEQANALVSHLTDPQTFGKQVPVPCISGLDPTYGTDMWRGPVWINYNYMIISGLREYGFGHLADDIRDKTLAMLLRWYRRTGTVFEFYDAEDRCPPSALNRKGPVHEPYDLRVRYQSIRDYGWSNTLGLDLLCSCK